ncbi:MAG: hypothetical protein R3C69_16870 [Geminicoccaceae bacterium]
MTDLLMFLPLATGSASGDPARPTIDERWRPAAPTAGRKLRACRRSAARSGAAARCARGAVVERLLDGDLVRQRLADLLVDHLAHDLEIAEADGLRGRCRLTLQELQDGVLAAGVGLVVAFGLGHLVGRLGDRHVAGRLVPEDPQLGAGQEIEEGRSTGIFLLGVLLEDVERRPADHRAVRRDPSS